MNEPEKVTLPKSGIELRMMPMLGRGGLWNYIDYRAIVGDLQLRAYQGHDGRWFASTPGGGYGGYATLPEAIDALDRSVLAIRSALLPADARERVREVLDWPALADVDVDDMADAILAALGIGGVR